MASLTKAPKGAGRPDARNRRPHLAFLVCNMDGVCIARTLLLTTAAWLLRDMAATETTGDSLYVDYGGGKVKLWPLSGDVGINHETLLRRDSDERWRRLDRLIGGGA